MDKSQRTLRHCIQRLKQLADNDGTSSNSNSNSNSNGESGEVARATLHSELTDVVRMLEQLHDITLTLPLALPLPLPVGEGVGGVGDGRECVEAGGAGAGAGAGAGEEEEEELQLSSERRGQAQDVPNEVRHWLQSTFRRSPPPGAGCSGSESAPRKFKTVARAVKMSLSVFNRQASCSSVLQPKVADFLKKCVNEWTFDVFKLNEITDGHALRATGTCLFERYALNSKFRVPASTLDCFLLNLEKGYSKHDNPYHNLMHAADVAQTMHYFINTYNLTEWLSDLQILAAVVAALIHDFEHNGTTNNFHVNSKSELALFYNDRAVLENHHASAAFRMMQPHCAAQAQTEDCNILAELTPDDYRSVRALVIEMVLATEMKAHCEQLKTVKTSLALNLELDRSFALGFLLHVADVAHPAKEWSVHRRWALLILDEFFRQGDIEKAKNLPVSPLCDRQTTLIPHSQIGFIDCVVSPSMAIVGDFFQSIATPLNSVPSHDDEQEQEQEREHQKAVSKPWDLHLQQNRQNWTEESLKLEQPPAKSV